MDECGSQTCVGDEGDVEVDGGAADFVAVGQFARTEVLGHVDHHVNFLVVEHIDGLRLTFFAGPIYEGIVNAILRQVTACAACGKEFVAMVSQHLGGREHFGFLLAVAR